jgi:hypothetical protein
MENIAAWHCHLTLVQNKKETQNEKVFFNKDETNIHLTNGCSLISHVQEQKRDSLLQKYHQQRMTL